MKTRYEFWLLIFYCLLLVVTLSLSKCSKKINQAKQYHNAKHQ